MPFGFGNSGPFARRRRRGAAFDPVEATGGTETVIEQSGKFYRVHTFLESGDLNVTQGGEVEYLVVAGGGGGGFDGYGGGGGAGFFRKYVSAEPHNTGAAVNLATGLQSVTVAIGSDEAETGADSSLSDVTAQGGGGGGDGTSNEAGAQGGCGGGGAGQSTNAGIEEVVDNAGVGVGGGDGGGGWGSREPRDAPQGGGGGGALNSGFDARLNDPDSLNASGGDGVPTSILGSEQYYCGGGAGGTRDGSQFGSGGLGGGGSYSGGTPESGAPNTGGGGSSGAGGGSGIVIVRYEITEEEYDAEAA